MKKISMLLALLVSYSAIAQLFGPLQLIDGDTGNIFVIEVADLDQDGYLDIITGSSAAIAWYRNMEGQGNFTGPLGIDQGMGQTFNLSRGDMDGDGLIDVVVSYFDEDMVVWYRNTGLGAFAPLQVVASGLNRPSGVIASDLDGDNDMDLVLGVSNGSGLYWVENVDGQGNFGPLITIDGGIVQARNQAVADIDGDGDMDVLTNRSVGVSWYENTDGQGTFTGPLSIANTNLYPNYLDLADIDGDDDFDVVLVQIDKGFWLENIDGQGAFGGEQSIHGAGFSNFRMGDLDLDDDMDMTSIFVDNKEIVWHENQDGQGDFGAVQLVDEVITMPANIVLGDFDLDGDLDMAANSLEANGEKTLVWYENLTILGTNMFELEKLQITPNPVAGFLSIENPYPIEKVLIYDALGRKLLEVQDHFKHIEVAFLSSGLMFVEVATKNAQVVRKIVKK